MCAGPALSQSAFVRALVLDFGQGRFDSEAAHVRRGAGNGDAVRGSLV